MSDNWVVQNLVNALNTWNEKLSEIWTLLTTSPQEFKGGAIWEIITNVHRRITGYWFSSSSTILCKWCYKNLWYICRSKKTRASIEAICKICISKSSCNLWNGTNDGSLYNIARNSKYNNE